LLENPKCVSRLEVIRSVLDGLPAFRLQAWLSGRRHHGHQARGPTARRFVQENPSADDWWDRQVPVRRWTAKPLRRV